VIVGSGGFARETAAAVIAINERAQTWELQGFVDDDAATHGRLISGVPVLGPVEAVGDSDAALVVCTGSPRNYFSRRLIVERLALPDERYATLVHPAAALGTTTRLGTGTVVLAGVVATIDVTIGAHVAVMPGTVFTHDDVAADFTTFGAGVSLAGGTRVSEGAYIGSGALVREDCTIGAWSLVGMGSIVLQDVPAGEVWIGAPARRLRAAAQPPFAT
jgi:sugar O-acyltransferase (sialic acid O-acetyltransferase NeuD family)